ncbi:MAG: 2-amino-4-hydroxy-6-hydroxymethyldihydropteridine diphosphokinase [Alistipes sp.]|jgi:2-amino-4-hydroxy-6-hydroxymethyldihydropteridine diphosphokinase|nr:2-amino-4-hydroxy-6-hydroxymethyldihydropteridine diphosphokinase [Alistipes sp.]
MAKVILSTGGNLGEMKPMLHRAQEMVNDQIGPVLRCSHRYKSEPWGFENPEGVGRFSNQVLVCDTDLTPRQVLEKVQAIEAALGRDRTAEAAEKARTGQPYASRVIDIDILFYDNETINEPDLQIPHPRIAEREFVLAPLRELGLYKL